MVQRRVAFCRVCGNAFLARISHGRWAQCCSRSHTQRLRQGKREQATQAMQGDPRGWFVDRLNAGISHEVLAGLLGMDRQAMYAWWRELGIHKVVRYE